MTDTLVGGNSTTHAEGMKCPCCNNPWARATGDLFAQLCADCKIAATENAPGISRENMDMSVNPADNFYYYANGGWIQKNPIPPGYPSWGTFLTLHVQAQEQCKELLENVEKSSQNNEEASKVAAFYKAAMDEDKIEIVGLEPLKPVLTLIDDILDAYVAFKEGSEDSKIKYAELIGQLSAKYGIDAFFGISESPDYKNSDHTLCNVGQGGIGLPDRDYYFDEDKQEIRDAYKAHIAKMLTLLDDPSALESSESALADATRVYELEVKLAESHMTRTESRDPQATYNKMSVADLTATGKDALPFASYFVGATNKNEEELGSINVRNTAALERVAEVASSVDAADLRAYLKWHTIRSCAPYLSKVFVDENFQFYEKKLSGVEEIKPRWKRAMAFTESALGEALGKLYCAKHFDEECKERALKIVESVRSALEERLKEVDWMTSDVTREEALKKMSRFRVKIGYPDRWIDYTTLTFEADDDFMTMVFKSREFHHRRSVNEMNAPTDREKWFLTPQTVNAYYHPSLNEVVFPAAILQHPFFDKEADDAINYGAMGAVVGHEMTHGFDDKGRKFNYAGILQDWWTEEDGKEYEARVEVMVEQANKFEVHGKAVQGKLTCGENIADLGGLRLALRALKAQPSFHTTDKINGFTPTQRFFLAWAQCWRQNITKERSLQLITLDPHGPNEMRCNGPLSNMPEFHEAFEVPEDSSMFKPKEVRVDIW